MKCCWAVLGNVGSLLANTRLIFQNTGKFQAKNLFPQKFKGRSNLCDVHHFMRYAEYGAGVAEIGFEDMCQNCVGKVFIRNYIPNLCPDQIMRGRSSWRISHPRKADVTICHVQNFNNKVQYIIVLCCICRDLLINFCIKVSFTRNCTVIYPRFWRLIMFWKMFLELFEHF